MTIKGKTGPIQVDLVDTRAMSGLGGIANFLLKNRMNVNALRLYEGEDERTYMDMPGKDGKAEARLVNNAVATLRRDDWILIDDSVVAAGRPQLDAVADLMSRGLTRNIPNGFGKIMVETELTGDVTGAILSMDARRQSESDRPEYDRVSIPLPIIHKDFFFSAREIEVSRNSGTPLDVTMAEESAEKVMEYAEQMLLGVAPSYSYGGGTIYGYTNFPNRLTKTLTAPTGGWTPDVLIDEILEMKALSVAAYYRGPWQIYVSTDWDAVLDADYSAAKGDNTLRDRILRINKITGVKTLDHLPEKTLLMVQMNNKVVREIIGMPLKTVQWESKGGFELNFKTMAIMVPQIRSDWNDKTGIVHGSYT